LTPREHPPKLHLVILAIVFLALGLRLLKAQRSAVIARDSVRYLAQAELLSTGQLREGLTRSYDPPGYAIAIAALSPLLGAEVAGTTISALAGALILVPIAALGLRLSWRCGLAAALILALIPRSVRAGGELLSESLYATILISAAWLASSPRSGKASLKTQVLAGALAASAGLVRAEGLITGLALILGAIPQQPSPSAEAKSQSPSRRGLVLLPLFAGFALVAIPYLGALSAVEGRLLITRKEGVILGAIARRGAAEGTRVASVHQHFAKENAARRRGQAPGSTRSRILPTLLAEPLLVIRSLAFGLARALRMLTETTHPLVFALAVPGLWLLARAQALPWPLLFAAAAQLLAVAAASTERRYLIPILPLMALGAAASLDALHKAPRGPNIAFTIAILAALLLPPAFEYEREKKRGLRSLGAWLQEHSSPGEKILGNSPRCLYYAQRSSLPIPHWRSPADAQAWLDKHKIKHIVIYQRWQQQWLPWLPKLPRLKLAARSRHQHNPLLLYRYN